VDEAIVKVVTVYGPLGLGWIGFWYMLQRYQALQEKVMQAFVADTELKASLKASVDQLIDTVKDIKRG